MKGILIAILVFVILIFDEVYEIKEILKKNK